MNRVELAIACGIVLASLNLAEAGKFRHTASSGAAAASAPRASEKLVTNDVASDVEEMLPDAEVLMRVSLATSELSDTAAAEVVQDQELALDLNYSRLVDYLALSPGGNATSPSATLVASELPTRSLTAPRPLPGADLGGVIENSPDVLPATDSTGLWEFFSRDLPMAANGQSAENRPIVIENLRYVSGKRY